MVLGLVLLLIDRPSISNIRKSVLKTESIVSMSPRGVHIGIDLRPCQEIDP